MQRKTKIVENFPDEWFENMANGLSGELETLRIVSSDSNEPSILGYGARSLEADSVLRSYRNEDCDESKVRTRKLPVCKQDAN